MDLKSAPPTSPSGFQQNSSTARSSPRPSSCWSASPFSSFDENPQFDPHRRGLRPRVQRCPSILIRSSDLQIQFRTFFITQANSKESAVAAYERKRRITEHHQLPFRRKIAKCFFPERARDKIISLGTGAGQFWRQRFHK